VPESWHSFPGTYTLALKTLALYALELQTLALHVLYWTLVVVN
jgi:hypothetical protein